MEAFKDSKTAVVADVDCTVEKDLCSKNGVRGYPTIKHGDPADLQDYKGGRDFDSLKSFADENLGPSCGPDNLDLCSDAQKADIAKYTEMSDDDLKKAIKEKEDALEGAEATFKSEVEKLQATYEQLQKDKENTIKEVKSSGLGTMKQIKNSRAKKKDEL